MFGYVNGIKIDFVKHHFFNQIGSTIEEGGVRMFDDKDLIAMKVFTALKRGHKKHFWDIALLLQTYTVQDFIHFYDAKYPNLPSPITIPYALTYFQDAEQTPDPISLQGQTWPQIKRFIQQKVSDFLK